MLNRSLAVLRFFWYLQPKIAVLNDVHNELVAFYRVIKSGGAKGIYEFCQEHKNEEKEYYEVRAMKPKDDFERACQFYYLRKTCYRGMLRYNKKGGFNVPYGHYKTFNNEILKNPEYERTMRGTTITQTSFENVFAANDEEDTFIFLDPPYDSTFTDYGYCSFGKEEHRKLAECFKSSKAKCMMVIGETPFIRELYKDFIKHSYPKKYRFKLHSGRVGSEIDKKHLVICNY